MTATSELLQLYQHVALPRDVPGKEDRNLFAIGDELLARLIYAVKTVRDGAPIDHINSLDAVRLTLETSKALNVDGKVDKSLLVKEIDGLGDNHALFLHVTEQNAALLVYKENNAPDYDLVIEAFETSASSEKVLASESALQWDFPGYAVSIPSSVHRDPSFQTQFSAFVEQASIESVKQFSAVTYKAAAPIPEIRDTTDPSLISGLLMTILEGNGKQYMARLLRKRVRDTVCFDAAQKPWRRSPFYLGLRVALQRHLYKVMGEQTGRLYYKMIMAMFLSQLLGDCCESIPAEASFFLLQKVAQRITKIEQEKPDRPSASKSTQEFLFSKLGGTLEKSLMRSRGFLERQWELHRQRNRRVIRLLPGKASPMDQSLQLPCSRIALEDIAYGGPWGMSMHALTPLKLLEQYQLSGFKTKAFSKIADCYVSLAHKIQEEIKPVKAMPFAPEAWDSRCRSIARTIKIYVSTVGDLYDKYPELKSLFILDLMELWIEMDRHAVRGFPLLKSYHPGFDAAILDTLQLLNLEDMKRLEIAQAYISGRCRGWIGSGSKTVFDPPAMDSFAVVYYDSNGKQAGLTALREEIEADADRSRAAKEEEWHTKSQQHEHKMQQIAESKCRYIPVVQDDGSIEREHQRPCAKHRYKWEAKQIKIQIFEHPLPAQEEAAKAAVFEIKCPSSFAAYRDATWLLLATLGLPQVTPHGTRPTIKEYPGLSPYSQLLNADVTLASRTKPHSSTHWSEYGFPVTLDTICRPCGLTLDYYDSNSGVWTKWGGNPSFDRHTSLSLSLPQASSYRCVDVSDGHNVWPSSNAIIASQTKCPPDLNVHEFMAWQGFLSGVHVRWLSLLRELGATNINFSTESTWAILSKLILHAGPSSLDRTLRDIHIVFEDETFCSKLLEQIKHRLEAIHRNWREPLQMDLLISFLLKIKSLSPSHIIQQQACALLQWIRTATWGWCLALRSSAAATTHEFTVSTIWASLLCKRTVHHSISSELSEDSGSLQTFLCASIVLQESLVGEFGDLPHALRTRVLQDLLYMFENQVFMAETIMSHHDDLISALGCIWPLPQEYMDGPPAVRLVDDWGWAEICIQARGQYYAHFVHYNYIRGDLLINGKQSGILPAEYHHPTIQKLFGTHALRVLPSYQSGMSFYVDRPMPYGYHIHLGFRKGLLVVRAVQNNDIFELIDPAIFSNGSAHDLPFALIHNCWHWLNLTTKVLEIRQDDMWKSKSSNWRLDLGIRQATKKNLTLVDPCSTIAQNIARNFHFFEYAQHIVITQPRGGPLMVELKRLELNFHVNRGLLQCRELGAEIAPTAGQDAKTWYGLRSMIVLRLVKNIRQRIILVAEGPLRFHKNEEHVALYVEPMGTYLKFELDDILGRIQCPAEHRLLYAKAMWHAYTSYFLPDPLTKQTGVEEALYLLNTALYKSWTPLGGTAIPEILTQISSLSPQREYYPTSLKCMEKVHWNPNLTTVIQDERYRRLIEKIWERSSQLHLFEPGQSSADPTLSSQQDAHLENRSLSRSRGTVSNYDTPYAARGRSDLVFSASNVALVTKMLCEWSLVQPNTETMVWLLEEFPIISGSKEPFDRVQIFDLMTVNLAGEWGSLVQTAIQSTIHDRYRLLFMFAPMALAQTSSMELLKALVSYAIIPEIKNIEPPDWPSYVHFKAHEVPTAESFAKLMEGGHVPYQQPTLEKDNVRGQLYLNRKKHEEECKEECVKFTRCLFVQWPNVEVKEDMLPNLNEQLVNREKALEPLWVEWKRVTQNYSLSKYVEKIQEVFHLHNTTLDVSAYSNSSIRHASFDEPDQYCIWESRKIPDLQLLLRKPTDDTPALQTKPPGARATSDAKPLRELPNGASHLVSKGDTSETIKRTHRTENIQELYNIVDALRDADSPVRQTYGLELKQSLDALEHRISQPPLELSTFNPALLSQKIHEGDADCEQLQRKIMQALESGDSFARWLKLGGLWPNMNRIALLSMLRSTNDIPFGTGTKEALVSWGVQITALQRLLRIQDASLKSKQQSLYEESLNTGHTNWEPLSQPDWLLLEIDSNVMLRTEQVEVANATISPTTGDNSVVQLLMGKGKTSCILPMVAAVLANKRQLLRVVVPRALLLQSAQVMQIKLGGLLDREVLHIPFSRRTKATSSLMEVFVQLHLNLKKNNGVMLSLPENILSFKLSGLQRLCDGEPDKAKPMIKMQQWLDRNARDVLDECDVSLAIRTQLIYPSGTQMVVDGHPLRWQTIQTILRLLRLHIPELLRQFPRSIEVVNRPIGDYPLLYFLRRDVEDYAISKIVDAVCQGQLAAVPCVEIESAAQGDIRAFISNPTVPSHTVRRLNARFEHKQHIMKMLHLLRGLIVHRILLSTLKKRWNVQYGLHPTRDPIAVPYHAKGVPSQTSEWGHPDVAIMLTCLSFYYQGLDIAQLKQAFEHLLKSDEPSIEYEKWVTKDLPGWLCDYTAINVEDAMQLREIHYYLRFNVFLLDFYMNNFVFPRYAKHFEKKLQASGWDLVLFDPASAANCRTTGFSGTNDSRHQLPMMIRQNDLPNFAHTNAEVLSYLLEPRSRYYVRMVDHSGKRLNEEGVLRKMFQSDHRKAGQERIRILIDAGAQILEHSNHDLVKAWLSIDEDALAGVYFDADHRVWVLYRNRSKMPLLASPFAENLEKCVVYLDESHCRGTDLKLPPSARAALTLGPHVTKDSLVQAAMRLRLLGQSQAVTFFSPPEVHQSILDLQKRPANFQVTSRDVISWLLKQSCNAIEQLEPLHFNQGNTFVRHEQAKMNNPDYLTNAHQRSNYLSVVETKESQTLKQLYEPKHMKKGGDSMQFSDKGPLGVFATRLKQRMKDFQDSGIAVHSSALEEVEIEREVEHEVENVRELQKPVHFTALKITRLHKDILEFARSGRIVAGSEAYQAMLLTLQSTATGKKHGAFSVTRRGSSGLFVSTQFCRTVSSAEPNDNFFRPCQWILWCPTGDTALVVSPEEADALLPYLRRIPPKSKSTGPTHLIVYSAPVTRRMLHFNDLDYHATPPLPRNANAPTWLKIELGILSGRLYFAWSEYQDLLSTFGVKRTVNQEENMNELTPETFVQKPLTFLHDWLAIIRKGQDFEHTPMGFVTTGKPLSADHPFFATGQADNSDKENSLDVQSGPQFQELEEEDEDYDSDGEDHYLQDDHLGQDMAYDEEFSEDEDGNTFFDAPEFVEGGREHVSADEE